jgi:CspA family cold shock protein
VLESPDTPDGCFAHFSVLWHEDFPEAEPGEVVHVSSGYKELFAGETVDFDWVPSHQDGYLFSAVSVWPRGWPAPHRTIRRYRPGE